MLAVRIRQSFSSCVGKEVKSIPYIRAYPGDILLVGAQTKETEAWFVSQHDSWYMLISVSDGTFHCEIAQLHILRIEDFHAHVSRIFEEYRVQVVKKGMARITVTVIHP